MPLNEHGMLHMAKWLGWLMSGYQWHKLWWIIFMLVPQMWMWMWMRMWMPLMIAFLSSDMRFSILRNMLATRCISFSPVRFSHYDLLQYDTLFCVKICMAFFRIGCATSFSQFDCHCLPFCNFHTVFHQMQFPLGKRSSNLIMGTEKI